MHLLVQLVSELVDDVVGACQELLGVDLVEELRELHDTRLLFAPRFLKALEGVKIERHVQIKASASGSNQLVFACQIINEFTLDGPTELGLVDERDVKGVARNCVSLRHGGQAHHDGLRQMHALVLLQRLQQPLRYVETGAGKKEPGLLDLTVVVDSESAFAVLAFLVGDGEQLMKTEDAGAAEICGWVLTLEANVNPLLGHPRF